MSLSPIAQWLGAYQAVWDSNEPSAIGRLFTETAEYRSYPWAEAAVGRDAIVALWLSGADAAGDHRFSWTEVGVDGDRHFIQGHTDYSDGRSYENLWIIDLNSTGSASRFTEWYMESGSKQLGPHA